VLRSCAWRNSVLSRRTSPHALHSHRHTLFSVWLERSRPWASLEVEDRSATQQFLFTASINQGTQDSGHRPCSPGIKRLAIYCGIVVLFWLPRTTSVRYYVLRMRRTMMFATRGYTTPNHASKAQAEVINPASTPSAHSVLLISHMRDLTYGWLREIIAQDLRSTSCKPSGESSIIFHRSGGTLNGLAVGSWHDSTLLFSTLAAWRCEQEISATTTNFGAVGDRW